MDPDLELQEEYDDASSFYTATSGSDESIEEDFKGLSIQRTTTIPFQPISISHEDRSELTRLASELARSLTLQRTNTNTRLTNTTSRPGLSRNTSRPVLSRNTSRPGLSRTTTRLSRTTTKLTESTSRTDEDLEKLSTWQTLQPNDPALDPSSGQFDVYKWARSFVRSHEKEHIVWRRAGCSFKNLDISGSGSALNVQGNVGSLFMAPFRAGEYFSFGHKPRRQILHNFYGLLKSGELLIVLGRPGSGCSTLLKTICGELSGLHLSDESSLQYNGITKEHMFKQFRGELVYNQEVDKHFPHLTVGQTLEFAASARTPAHRIMGASRTAWAKNMTKVWMAVLGLSHTYNTKVGNDFVRGVSGGERKRVSIAEMGLAGAPLAAWDNATRGLDSATALEFVKTLRMSADLVGTCHAVAIYQASQAIYDVFHKAVVLYEGRQIYFGPADEAEDYFTRMGWVNPARQTVGDFLTSVTNPHERQAKPGMEDKVPRTPEEFEEYWKKSPEFAALQWEIEQHEQEFPINENSEATWQESKHDAQARHKRAKSPYLITIPMQVKLCTVRAYQRLWNDKTSTITTVIGQVVMALIVGSVFYGTPDASAGFFAKGSALFFGVLLNALVSLSEVNSLYDQRPIVEKQASYAFYHPFAEALGGIVSDIPVKFVMATAFNVILYFLVPLRMEPAPFFIFFLFTFIAILTMSAIFRTMAAATKTVSQALAISGVLVLAIFIYTGFIIPRPDMHPWFQWISYVNPVFYAFEAVVANEFHNRNFTCSGYVPAYPVLTGDQFVCGVSGAVAGQRYVSGDAYIAAQYGYEYSHIWRNFAIMIAFWIGFQVIYLLATELNNATTSAAEFLVFRRGHVPQHIQNLIKKEASGEPVEISSVTSSEIEGKEEDNVNALPAQKDVFTWRNVVYDIPLKTGERRLLDHVSGWVKPGTLTALMGVSGAGKTTLLDVLAQRVSFGVITGDMLVNGRPLDPSFQRKTGYVQQQDLHLQTSTVREALQFSAMLRQPKSTPKQEKFDYVEDVIKMLNMEEFAEAVVGSPGEGLNVEQRKLLTIGVELAAKPALLLFLDEPTSGLDSQSSWAICAFLRKLADNGQAVLSTIHQPSAILFQEFDRLLFLAKGGRTVYFGDIGKQSHTLLDYFESNGARACLGDENPAEYMLEIIGAGSTGRSERDWPDVWKHSHESEEVQIELDRIHRESRRHDAGSAAAKPEKQLEFAMPFASQLYYVTQRVFQQYWRLPSYIFGKVILGIMSALFIGFSFWKPVSSMQGVQDIVFSVFMLAAIFSPLVQQIMPHFVTQRSLYEVRERPSKAYSWVAFLIANIIVELPYQVLVAIIVWVCYYFPIFGSDQTLERQGLILLYTIQFFVFASTFAHLVIAALPDAETAGNIAVLLFSLTLSFNGVMQAPAALPGFWFFMYRVSPLTYMVSGISATGLHDRLIDCAANELNVFNPPPGTTCAAYLAEYLEFAPGYLQNPSALADCAYCAFSVADQGLAPSNVFWDTRWRNFAIGWAYVVFNIAGATALYYTFRVKHWSPRHTISHVRDGLHAVMVHFKRRGPHTPKGRQADKHRVF